MRAVGLPPVLPNNQELSERFRRSKEEDAGKYLGHAPAEFRIHSHISRYRLIGVLLDADMVSHESEQCETLDTRGNRGV